MFHLWPMPSVTMPTTCGRYRVNICIEGLQCLYAFVNRLSGLIDSQGMHHTVNRPNGLIDSQSMHHTVDKLSDLIDLQSMHHTVV